MSYTINLDDLKEENNIWFTSDLHFTHKSILKFCFDKRKQFLSQSSQDFILENQKATKEIAEEFKENFIQYWNSLVKPNDIVFHLGDFNFYDKFNALESLLERLNGKLFLILGNHDHNLVKHKEKILSLSKENGVKFIGHYLKIKIVSLKNKTEQKIVLNHYPMFNWEDQRYGAFMLHGHIHDSVADVKGRILNVGFDLHGKILTYQNIVNYLSDLPTYSHHGENMLKLPEYPSGYSIKEKSTIEDRLKTLLLCINEPFDGSI